MDSDREQRIRERAYSIWEAEGKPDGRHAENWAEAEREFGDDRAATNQNPPGGGSKKPQVGS